jgi:hypothetical protein
LFVSGGELLIEAGCERGSGAAGPFLHLSVTILQRRRHRD